MTTKEAISSAICWLENEIMDGNRDRHLLDTVNGLKELQFELTGKVDMSAKEAFKKAIE